MDFMKLFGTVIAVLFHPGSASKINGQRICRRGTERPCYKVSYIQDSRRRLTFEDARQACRLDGGELLSLETESEQRLIERFIQQLQAGDGDFWIGLRRSPQRFRPGATSPGCPSQYYWLDGSKAKFRNWHWDEPSCGGEMCVVLYHQPSAPPDEEGHFLFQWNDDNCNSKNNYVCKYPEDKVPAFTEAGNTVRTVPSLRPNLLPTTESDEKIKIGLPESSVSLSDNTLYVSYILCATIPALLLLLFVVTGFFCYRQVAKRRKTETESYPSGPEPWMSTPGAPCTVQGPYAFSDISKLHHTALGSSSSVPAGVKTKYPCAPSPDAQCDDYENVSCPERESGFVTNDIYETCREQSRHCRSQTGWVENEIYG
ncbi:chondrolectin [Centroberyx gerrardi]|uniref:chondrolectin n=1 Tax=Centroberyx gerrardi TaxID=166262 RepID=UPI003AAC41D2